MNIWWTWKLYPHWPHFGFREVTWARVLSRLYSTKERRAVESCDGKRVRYWLTDNPQWCSQYYDKEWSNIMRLTYGKNQRCSIKEKVQVRIEFLIPIILKSVPYVPLPWFIYMSSMFSLYILITFDFLSLSTNTLLIILELHTTRM